MKQRFVVECDASGFVSPAHAISQALANYGIKEPLTWQAPGLASCWPDHRAMIGTEELRRLGNSVTPDWNRKPGKGSAIAAEVGMMRAVPQAEWDAVQRQLQELQAQRDAAMSKLRMLYGHWNEFGPLHGFGEVMDKLQEGNKV